MAGDTSALDGGETLFQTKKIGFAELLGKAESLLDEIDALRASNPQSDTLADLNVQFEELSKSIANFSPEDTYAYWEFQFNIRIKVIDENVDYGPGLDCTTELVKMQQAFAYINDQISSIQGKLSVWAQEVEKLQSAAEEAAIAVLSPKIVEGKKWEIFLNEAKTKLIELSKSKMSQGRQIV